MIDGSFLQRGLVFQELRRNRTCIFLRSPPSDNDPRRLLVAAASANGKSQAGRASDMPGVVSRFVVRHDIGRTNACGKTMGWFGKQISGSGGTPLGFLASHGSGPHQVQYRTETGFDIHRARAFRLVGDDRARFVERNKKSLADYKIGSGIDAGHSFRTVDNTPEYGLAINPGGFTLMAKAYGEGADDLHRIGPEFQAGL